MDYFKRRTSSNMLVSNLSDIYNTSISFAQFNIIICAVYTHLNQTYDKTSTLLNIILFYIHFQIILVTFTSFDVLHKKTEIKYELSIKRFNM